MQHKNIQTDENSGFNSWGPTRSGDFSPAADFCNNSSCVFIVAVQEVEGLLG